MLKASGRTTRLLAEAISQDRSGRAVYVLTLDASHAESLKEECLRIAPDVRIKFEAAGCLRNLSWEQVRLVGAHPNCLVLIDHAAIEAKFGALLQMLHRFDAPVDAGHFAVN